MSWHDNHFTSSCVISGAEFPELKRRKRQHGWSSQLKSETVWCIKGTCGQPNVCHFIQLINQASWASSWSADVLCSGNQFVCASIVPPCQVNITRWCNGPMLSLWKSSLFAVDGLIGLSLIADSCHWYMNMEINECVSKWWVSLLSKHYSFNLSVQSSRAFNGQLNMSESMLRNGLEFVKARPQVWRHHLERAALSQHSALIIW